MDTRPQLPQKLPIEARKKRSVVNIPDVETLTSQSTRDARNNDEIEYCEYSSPSEPHLQQSPTQQPSMKSNNDTDEHSNELEFFNDSIYFDPSEKIRSGSDDANQDDYSSLASYTSPSSESTTAAKQVMRQKFAHAKNPRRGPSLDATNGSNTCLIELAADDSSPRPAIPPKRKLSEQFGKLTLTQFGAHNNNHINKSKTCTEDEEVNMYIPPSDKKVLTFDEFRSAIFSSRENRMCADCKYSHELPTWVSCVYFMLYCESCAEIHLKLSHVIRPFYMLELSQIYASLMDSEFFCDAASFVYMITEQAGNEKINSLLEFRLDQVQRDQDEASPSDMSRDKFIREKYLNKKYVNQSDVGDCGGGNRRVDELSRSLLNYCVVSPCLPITIFNVFMGADVNSTSKSRRRSALDTSIDFNQKFQAIYLRFQGALTHSQLAAEKTPPGEEFVGELNQIIDLSNRTLSRSRILLKLCNDNQLLIVYLNRQTQTIALNSIVSVSTELAETTNESDESSSSIIEIKWLRSRNDGSPNPAALLSTYLEFFNSNEKQQWLRQLCTKMSGRMLSSSTKTPSSTSFDVDSCRIKSMWYLLEIKFDDSSERCLLVLFESSDVRVVGFCKQIVMFDRDSRVDIDVRKIVRTRFDQDNNDLVVLDTLPTRSFRFRSPLPATRVASELFARLTAFARLGFAHIDEQFLNKDGCPLVVDKLCSFVEIYHLTERLFYSLHSDAAVFDAKTSGSNRVRTMLARVESERDYALDCKQVTPTHILAMFRVYFGKYFRTHQLDVIRNPAKLKLNSSSVLFASLKRLVAHLVLVARYQALNKHSIDELARLFAHLIAPDGSVSLDEYVLNYREMFGLSEEFFKLQSNIVDKLIAMRAARNTNEKCVASSPLAAAPTQLALELSTTMRRTTSYLAKIYWMSKSSEKFVQVAVVGAETRARDVLSRVVGEFGVTTRSDSEVTSATPRLEQLSLFEVTEQQFCSLQDDSINSSCEQNNSHHHQQQHDSCLLERVLPVNTLLLNASCHDWSRFSLVVKENYFNTGNTLVSGSFHDACFSLNAAFANPITLKAGFFQESHKKWRPSYLSVQNACIRISERGHKPSSTSLFDPDESSSSSMTIADTRKVFFEAKIEECLIYYGLYEGSSSVVSSPSASSLTEPTSPSSSHSILDVSASSIGELKSTSSSFIRKLLFNSSTSNAHVSSSPASSHLAVNRENCLTFYHLVDRSIHSVCLETKASAIARYASLFKLAHYPDTWSIS